MSVSCVDCLWSHRAGRERSTWELSIDREVSIVRVVSVDREEVQTEGSGAFSILDTSFCLFGLMCSWLRFFLRVKVNFMSDPQRSNKSILSS